MSMTGSEIEIIRNSASKLKHQASSIEHLKIAYFSAWFNLG